METNESPHGCPLCGEPLSPEDLPLSVSYNRRPAHHNCVYPEPEYDPEEEGTDITFGQFESLFEEMDGSKIEYWDAKMRLGGRPFYAFVKDYLALRGEEPRRVGDQ